MLGASSKHNFFVADGDYHDVDSLNSFIKKELGVSSFKIKLPIAVIKLVGILSEWIGKLKNEYPPLNKEKVNEIKSLSWVCDTQPLIELGWKPSVNLEQGMKQTIAWNKEHKYL